MRPSFVRCATLVGIGVLAACSDGTGPIPESSYALRSVEGRPLPAPLPSIGTVNSSLVADSIHFFADGRFTRVRIRRDVPVNGPTTEFREDLRGDARRMGGAIVLDAVCGDTPGSLAICVPPDTARRLGAILEIGNSFLPPGGRLLFETVTP